MDMKAQEIVFDALVGRIVTGVYGKGTNLPAERELAAELGTSRATLREALRRLEQGNLISARRGSGVVVKDICADATLELLPSYLLSRTDPREAASLVVDLLALRTGLILTVLRLVGGRLAPGQLDEARRALALAHAERDDFARFALLDFAVLQEIVRAAQFLPGVWLLNSVRSVYVDLAQALRGIAISLPPPRYRAVYTDVFAHLEGGRIELAAAELEQYFAQHDRRFRAALGIAGGK